MTDREILELLLQKMDTLENKASEIEKKMATKRQLMESTAKLKAMDEMILDEVERVHDILGRHKEDKTVHTA